MQPFTRRVIEIIRSIPEGRVMTYGQIARFAGSPRGARQVVRILHAMSASYGLPWYRVVNVKGEVALTDEESRFMQILYLNGEGVAADEDGRIDLERYLYMPERASVDAADEPGGSNEPNESNGPNEP